MSQSNLTDLPFGEGWQETHKRCQEQTGMAGGLASEHSKPVACTKHMKATAGVATKIMTEGTTT